MKTKLSKDDTATATWLANNYGIRIAFNRRCGWWAVRRGKYGDFRDPKPMTLYTAETKADAQQWVIDAYDYA